MNLPADASPDQSNVPHDYYRRNNGMLHQLTEQPRPAAEVVTVPTLEQLENMPKDALRSLLERVCDAGWGYAGLKGKHLVEMALKSDDEAYDSLMLAALTLAKNAKEWREFHALSTFWAERKKGKPVTPVAVDARIGIMQIVANIGNAVIEDNNQ